MPKSVRLENKVVYGIRGTNLKVSDLFEMCSEGRGLEILDQKPTSLTIAGNGFSLTLGYNGTWYLNDTRSGE